MTPHEKAHHIAHSSCSPTYAGATVRRRTPVEWEIYDNFVATGNLNPVVCGSLSQVRQTSRRRFSAALEAQSTVLRGGAYPWANHSEDGLARRDRTSEHLFQECMLIRLTHTNAENH